VLELITETVDRVRTIDPHDTVASLSAAWDGFGTVQAAGFFLAEDNPDHAVLAANARPVLNAVAERLRRAPSLPAPPQVVEMTVTGLVPARAPRRGKGAARRDEDAVIYGDPDPDEAADPSPAAGAVRQAILWLSSEVSGLLSEAAEHAHDVADRQACLDGVRLSYELASCWQGRLRSYLNRMRKDL
jgi:hypothetical protein